MTHSFYRRLLWLGLFASLGCSSHEPVYPAPTMTMVTEERQQGSALYRTLIERMQRTPSRNAALVDPVVRIAARVIAAARQSASGPMAGSFSWNLWEVAVVEDERVRRLFVLPEGGIVVYTGIFRIAETEAGLAAILCHEFAHPLVRHGAVDMSALFTRDQELEADAIAVKLMADAGYDPREMLQVWERMRRQDESTEDPLLSHITYDRRMTQITTWLPEALLLYERSRHAPQKALPVREIKQF